MYNKPKKPHTASCTIKNMNRITRHILLPATAALLLSSCGIYGSFKEEMAQVRPDAYGRDSLLSASDDTLGLASYQWRDIFTDPHLQTLIDSALSNNTDLRVAQLQCEEAFASLRAAKLAYLPSFSIGADGSLDGPMDDSGMNKSWNAPLSASWQIDLFGSIRNSKRKAAAMLEQSKAYEQAVRSQLVAAVASTYYSLAALDEQYRIYQETERSWKESVETTRRLMAAGKYNLAAVSQAEANYYGVCISLVEIKRSIRELENTMCSLLGTPSADISRGSISGWSEPESVSGGIPVYAIANRPDIAQAAKAYEAAFYATNQARSAMYPSLTITGTANFAAMIWNAAGSLLEPIFQRGTLTAQLKIAKAQQEEAALKFAQAVTDAGIEVNNIMLDITSAKEKGEYYRLQEEALTEGVRSNVLLMEQRSGTYLEILTAQTSLLSAQISRVSNKLDEINGVISLYQALGGGKE